MQGGHLALAPPIAAAVAGRGPFDLVLATSMTNLPALLGVARGSIGSAPVALYMHENQLTYPLAPDDSEDLTYAMINHSSIVAADLVVFNSEFHRRAWFEAVPALLDRMPDHLRLDDVDAARNRSAVLPVGVDLRPLDAIPRSGGGRPLILWNQRWDHDKSPGEFADAMVDLAGRGYAFDIALAGERADPPPPDLVRLRGSLGDRIVHDGHAEVGAYRALLRRADIVVSTACQEFFGVALTEAVYAGAFPIVPDRLVYPERIPAEHHAACLYPTPAALVDRLRWAIERSTDAARIAVDLRPAMAAADWSNVAPRYDRALSQMHRQNVSDTT